jgi:hypothetical protein
VPPPRRSPEVVDLLSGSSRGALAGGIASGSTAPELVFWDQEEMVDLALPLIAGNMHGRAGEHMCRYGRVVRSGGVARGFRLRRCDSVCRVMRALLGFGCGSARGVLVS